ncbi:hypothetical protein [Plantactinospora veratri]
MRIRFGALSISSQAGPPGGFRPSGGPAALRPARPVRCPCRAQDRARSAANAVCSSAPGPASAG